MNAFAAVASVGLGLIGFRETLGTTPIAVGVHIIAILLVLGCVRPLTRAQERLIHGQAAEPVSARSGRQIWRPTNPFAGTTRAAARELRAIGTGLIMTIVTIAVAAASVGLLYRLRQLRWLALGPRSRTPLPLLQLAGFASQPLARVLVASLVAGIALGVVLVWIPVAERTAAIALVAGALLLLVSEACYALAQNLGFARVIVVRAPGLGPWVQFMALAVGSVLPAAVVWAIVNRSRSRAVQGRPRSRTGAGAGATEICT